MSSIITERQIYDLFTSRGWQNIDIPNPRGEGRIVLFQYQGIKHNGDRYEWFEPDGKTSLTFTQGAKTIICDEFKGKALLLEPNYYCALRDNGNASVVEVYDISVLLNSDVKADKVLGCTCPVRNKNEKQQVCVEGFVL